MIPNPISKLKVLLRLNQGKHQTTTDWYDHLIPFITICYFYKKDFIKSANTAKKQLKLQEMYNSTTCDKNNIRESSTKQNWELM